ncbi:nitroreductase [Cystobacter fuscus DSM 2262]|uniref:Nitroreductase n=1 Tax=Cystobacter fuscus (strain ATCC 25194 / DSM 2262 / NBRC 100088 / M29) TaxID=1242864 RepID=S9PH15_CYSF2|nr:SagB/ThcOx family dehydrogenase [Cystobacter fuscus]EPX61707.1 nitroreductase [Cystobacter fuscus DSM 2262]
MLSTLKLNPLFRIRFDRAIHCDLLLEGETVEFPSPRFLELLAAVRSTCSREQTLRLAQEKLEVSEHEAADVIEDLITHHVLVSGDEERPELPAVKHWVDRNWLDGLILHLRSKDLKYEDDGAADPRQTNDQTFRSLMEAEKLPPFWKEYPDAQRIQLPPPAPFPRNEHLADVLLRRRSNRPYKVRRISLDVLSRMLTTANLETVALRERAEREVESNPGTMLLNSAFSALETYVAVYDVVGLAPGLYHYSPRDRSLVLVKEGSVRQDVQKVCIGQALSAAGACSFLISAAWKRYMYRYRHPRAYRNLMVNVAELAQKYLVLATAMDLHTFLTPNLLNDEADRLVGVNGYDEGILYVVTAG